MSCAIGRGRIRRGNSGKSGRKHVSTRTQRARSSGCPRGATHFFRSGTHCAPISCRKRRVAMGRAATPQVCCARILRAIMCNSRRKEGGRGERPQGGVRARLGLRLLFKGHLEEPRGVELRGRGGGGGGGGRRGGGGGWRGDAADSGRLGLGRFVPLAQERAAGRVRASVNMLQRWRRWGSWGRGEWRRGGGLKKGRGRKRRRTPVSNETHPAL